MATSLQLAGVSDALGTIMEIKDFAYWWAPLMLIFAHRKLLKSGYYSKVKTAEKVRISVLKC